MGLRWRSSAERIRTSLFFVPMLAVVGAVLGSQALIAVDTEIDTVSWPLGLKSTVESARAVLVTIAGATTTFAGIAFSVSLLLIQLGSSQFSPRVVHTLFRDPFNKRVMALVVGTFTYCLMVLRAVRAPGEDSAAAVIPDVAVSVGLVLGVATILATVAFINHSAHSMDVSEILERVTGEAIGQIRREWEPDGPGPPPEPDPDRAAPGAYRIRCRSRGWVRQIDDSALLRCLPEGGVIWLETYPGRYAVPGTPLCSLAPPPDDATATEEAIHASVEIGETRTMQQDIAFGLRQLVDVALKALSPGVNDPTTARDATFHATAVLAELLRHHPPRAQTGEGGRRIVFVERYSHEELIGLTFDEVRRAASGQPTMCVNLLVALAGLDESLRSAGLHDRSGPIVEQARLIVQGCEGAGLLPLDLDRVRRAYEQRF